MKRVMVVLGFVVCVVVALAAKGTGAAVQDPAYLVKMGSIYEVSFCGGPW